MLHSFGQPRPELPPPPAGYDSWRFGPAFLRPATEREHYELMRPIFVERNEGDRVVRESYPEPFGPIAVYRTKRNGDMIGPQQSMAGPPPEMRSMDSKGQPITLILVWWPGADEHGHNG